MLLSEICTREELIELVHAEIVGIRANATPEEKAKLNFATFNPTNNQCIYGQMTGWWSEARANEITRKSLPNFDNDKMGYESRKHRTFENAIMGTGKYFTPMEVYFYLNNNGDGGKVAEHEGIIKFIKGESTGLIITIPE